METAEMRYLTVPQFAKRVRRSEDEVLAMIAARDVKALRPDPEGGFRVLETEVDRYLQTKATRIKRVERTEGQEAIAANTVPLEHHLSTVTSLEAERQKNSRMERLNSALQADLFQYLRLLENQNKELIETRIRFRSSHERLLQLEKERIAAQELPWWRRLFLRK